MALTRVDGIAGPPWERELKGSFDKLVVSSEILAGNPLGDPATRPLYVYMPPGGGDALPSIYVIQGVTGQLDMWMDRSAFEPTMLERVDALFSSGDVPPAAIVFIDAWTAYGGSQFINSTATGNYMDYICDEIVHFVDDNYPTAAERDRRALTGKSSGGYGAMVVPMLRPDVFGALASHAGDALFECVYLPEFRQTVRVLRDKFEGSYDVFWKKMKELDHLDWNTHGAPLNSYAMAACYSPDESDPGAVELPFDVNTGRLDLDVWHRWLEWDPVRMAPKHARALASMRLIWLDAGKSDEFYLDLGAQAFSDELADLGIDHRLEFFEGGHSGIQYRYPLALRALAEALSG